MNYNVYLMNSHFIEINMCISFVLCQRCNITVENNEKPSTSIIEDKNYILAPKMFIQDPNLPPTVNIQQRVIIIDYGYRTHLSCSSKVHSEIAYSIIEKSG